MAEVRTTDKYQRSHQFLVNCLVEKNCRFFFTDENLLYLEYSVQMFKKKIINIVTYTVEERFLCCRFLRAKELGFY